jgi:hypothetical protein
MTDSTTGPEADARREALLARIAKHNGQPVPAAKDGPPPVDDDTLPENTSPATVTTAPNGAHWSLIVAILWAIAAVIIGLVFVFGVNAETYGGDAYTGIEAAIVQAVHAVGWVIISMGVLGLVIAGSRPVLAKS